MQAVATGVLAAMALVFAVSASLKPAYPALAWVEAFSEAALIGGLADWFAVVALFRHPAGIPLPHTAIVPTNKDRIGTQLGLFVEQNFLTATNLASRLRAIDPAGHALRWIAVPDNVRTLLAGVRGLVPRLVDVVDDAEIHVVVRRIVVEELDEVDFANAASAALAMVTAQNLHQRALERVLPALARRLDTLRPEIKRRFARRSIFTPGFVDAYIVNRFVDGMIDLVGEIAASPDHPMRRELDSYLADLAVRLRDDPQLATGAERVKESLLRGTSADDVAAAAWSAVRARLAREPAADVASGARFSGLIARVAQGLLAEAALVERLNVKAGEIAEAVLPRFQHQFAALITEVVDRWDAREISDKIETELGPDLQYVRLNGSIVGGAAGVLLHAALTLAHAT
ncbi:MAG TPA: DUF445 domain-containing protein [Candidatus Elarobacter sp.]|jgi:uncharacterized membrane-anchored protein YjiN (DUF445 family)|nr:DUF445 domain-containing protein [Candidatus Elarobacter sp.]